MGAGRCRNLLNKIILIIIIIIMIHLSVSMNQKPLTEEAIVKCGNTIA